MIYLGCDHGGFQLKETLKQYLQQAGYPVHDCGSTTFDAADDFTAVVPAVVQGVLADPAHCGILICGTGIGMSIAANHYAGIRAALVYTSDCARLAREHNDANILCLGGRVTEEAVAKTLVDIFLTTPASADAKYHRRMVQAAGSKR